MQAPIQVPMLPAVLRLALLLGVLPLAGCVHYTESYAEPVARLSPGVAGSVLSPPAPMLDQDQKVKPIRPFN